MKHYGLICAALLLGGCVCGCNGPDRKPPQPEESVKVIVDGGGAFPPSLAGAWQADDHGWEIVLDDNGRITSAVISLGRIRIKPGETTTVPLRMKGEGIFEPGQWLVQYTPAERNLVVEILVEKFNMTMGGGTLRGSTRDLLMGPVSPNGQTWQAQWFSYPEYFIDTDIHTNKKLEDDPNLNPKATLTFTKTTPQSD